MHISRKFISVILVLAMAAFAGSCTQYHYQGAAAGGAIGGLAGALLDDDNPWRGGVIGAALGAAFGATLADISVRGSREAARTGEPVQYKTDDGREVYRADPLEYDAETKCRKVRERVWREGKLVQDETREVCESEKYEKTYGDDDYAYGGRDYDDDDYEYEHRSKRGGPPPWAPAHGNRAKHRYRYYPSSYVYYSVDREIYFYYSGGKWTESTRLPRGLHLDREEYVMLDMDEDRPYKFHTDVVKRYPPSYSHHR